MGATQRVNPFYGRGPGMKLFICFIMICIVGALPVSSKSEAQKKYDTMMDEWKKQSKQYDKVNELHVWDGQYEVAVDGTVSVSEPKPQPPGDGSVGVIYLSIPKKDK